eukprot:jgi/Psemu1/60417/gm1.60417_g
MQIRRRVKAGLKQQGPNGFSENILTDELITAVSRDIKSVFSHVMNKVFIVTKLSSPGTRPDFSEQETADKPSSGPIPRVVDVMVNLFLRDSGSQLTKKVCILDPKELTTRFKEYEMKDKWNAFQSALNSVIKIDDNTTAGATEFTRVEGQDKVAEGTSHSVWAKNVVNYDTILKYMKVYLSLLWWYVRCVQFPPAPSPEAEGLFFNQRFKDNVKKGKLYVQQMVSFFEGLSFHHALRHFLSASHSFEQLDYRMNQIRGQEVVGAPTREGVAAVELVPLTDSPKYLKLEWPYDVSKIPLAFQKKARIFQELSLHHFADESLLHDNLYKELLPNLNESSFLERDIFVNDFDPDDEVHVKILLQHYLLSLSCVENVVSTPDQLDQVNLVCDELLHYVLTSRLSRGPNGTCVPVTRIMVSKATMKAVLGKEEKTSFNIDNAHECLDKYLKAERKSLLSNSNPGEPHRKDRLFIFTNNGPRSVQFEEQTPPELVRGKECQHTFPITKEDYSVSVTRFLNFDENCTYMTTQRL